MYYDWNEQLKKILIRIIQPYLLFSRDVYALLGKTCYGNAVDE